MRFVAAEAAANHLIQTDIFKQSQHIACYFAAKNEFDGAAIIAKIWEAKKHCYLPILSTIKPNTLRFALYEYCSSLKLNRYRIPEPDTSVHFPVEQLDLVIMPLVGFDLDGHRLGMGGGYFDRTFQFVQEQKYVKPFLLGLGYEEQKINHIPIEPWDISLNGVLTEKQIYLF